MLQHFVNFYRTGDNTSLLNKLLHSCSWQQHQFKAYGQGQIAELLQRWMGDIGRADVTELQVVNSSGYSFYALELVALNTKQKMRVGLLVHHNHQHIKMVECYCNTLAWGANNNFAIEAQLLRLPTPDPLVVSDYDHQDHLQDDAAKPSDFLSEQSVLAVLEPWWRIWSVGQLSQIEQVYADSAAVIGFDDDAQLTKNALFDLLIKLRSGYSRVYCQLQQIIGKQQNGQQQVAVRWYLEGDNDKSGQRERLHFASVLTIADNRIQKELLFFDGVAHLKRYPESPLLMFAEQSDQ